MHKTALTCAVLALLGLGQPAIAGKAEEKAPAGAAPAAAGRMDIFVNELGAGWENRSWAPVELGIEVQGSSRKPIRVEPGPWEALYLHHAPFSTAPYRKLKLLIQSSAASGKPVRVIALADGKPLNEQGKLVSLNPGGWTQVEIPLSNLKADNVAIDGIWIQNGTDQKLPPFYVSDITLE